MDQSTDYEGSKGKITFLNLVFFFLNILKKAACTQSINQCSEPV